jgi:hypothetical protein
MLDSLAYELRFLPDPADVSRYGHRLFWDAWWWIRFPGAWGARRMGLGRSGIPGPAFQGDRWVSPWDWVGECCTEDRAGSWERLRRDLLTWRRDQLARPAAGPRIKPIKMSVAPCDGQNCVRVEPASSPVP